MHRWLLADDAESGGGMDMSGVEARLDQLIDVLSPDQPDDEQDDEQEEGGYNAAEYVHPLRDWIQK